MIKFTLPLLLLLAGCASIHEEEEHAYESEGEHGEDHGEWNGDGDGDGEGHGDGSGDLASEDRDVTYTDTSAPEDTSADSALVQKAADAFQAGSWDEAVELYREVVIADPTNGHAWHHLGYSLHVMGKLDEALKCHIKAANSRDHEIGGMGAYNAACVYSMQNNKDKAYEWLGQAIEVGFIRMDTFQSDPDLDNIRNAERFEELMDLAEQRLEAAEGEG